MSVISLINTAGLAKAAAIGGRIVGNFQRDPRAPVYELNIYGSNGAQAYSVSDKVKQFIESIEYEDNADQFDRLVITFRSNIGNFGGDEINSFIDSRIFAEGHIIEVKAGFGRSLFTVGAAQIISIEADFPQNSPPTLVITCYDLLNRAAKNKHPKGISYEGLTDTKIIQTIGERNGFVVNARSVDAASSLQNLSTGIGSSILASLPNSGAFKSASSFFQDNLFQTTGVFTRVQKKGMSDYKMMKKLADINGLDLFTKFDPTIKKFVLFFRKPGFVNQKEIFIFAYNEGDLPYHNSLLSFTPRLDAYDQATDFEIKVLKDKNVLGSEFSFNKQFGLREQQEFISRQERRYTGGANPASKLTDGNGIRVSFKAYGRQFRFPPHKRFRNQAEARKAIEEFIKRQKENFITADGVILGNEVIQSRQIHKFEGVSEQFSGKYYLSKVTHSIDRDQGYMTKFSCRRVIEDVLVQDIPSLSLAALGNLSSRAASQIGGLTDKINRIRGFF